MIILHTNFIKYEYTIIEYNFEFAPLNILKIDCL